MSKVRMNLRSQPYASDERAPREENVMLDIMEGVEEVGEALQDVADTFYEDPEAFLTEIETTLVTGCYEDADREAQQMAEGQRQLEAGWEELTWRAREVEGTRLARPSMPPSERWQPVQDFIAGLNEFGRKPSEYMTMGREWQTAQKKQQCDDFARIMGEWKQKVLDDLQTRDEWGLNLAHDECVSGDAVDSFGDGCDWYVGMPDSCGNYDHEFFTAALECCACGGGSALEPECQDTNYGLGDTAGDTCEWYAAGNQAYCGQFDTADFKAKDMCCACDGGSSGPLSVPEWNIDLDYAQADVYAEQLEQEYEAHHARMVDVLTRWKIARDEVDQYYWNEELLPVLAEGERLDERTMRTLVTWIADGTEIKGKPLVEVFPEVEEWMLDNYNPEGRTVIETFRMEQMPMMLQAREPMTFSFHFDEAAIQGWLEQEGRMYEQIDRMYQSTWQDYVNDMMPIWESMGELNERYERKFREIDETLQIQLEDTFSDAQHWWEDSFTVSLAAKLSNKKGEADYGMYAAVGAITLVGMFVAGLVYKKSRKSVDNTMANTSVSEALVN